MASACISRPINLNNNRNSNNNNINNSISSLQNNQNFIIISQSNFNQMTQQIPTTTLTSASATTTTTPVNSIINQKLKNLTTIASTPSTQVSQTTTSILGMNSINIQSNQNNSQQIIQQSNNCGNDSIGNIIVNNGTIYKKKFTYANIPYGTELPPSVARRNARERNRVKQVNNGYANLRQHIPQTIVSALTNGGRGASKKLSKVDTLRMAVEYIRRLQDVLIDENGSDHGSDGGSLYNSSNMSSSSGNDDLDSNGSPQSSTYYHNIDSPLNDNNHHHHQHHHHHQQQQQQQHQQINHNGSDNNNIYMINQINGYSDASVSPAPSYTSEISIGSNHNNHINQNNNNNNNNHHQNNYLLVQSSTSPNLNEQNQNLTQNQFKFEPYDNSYNSITDTTPEDEELLDYISSWQQQ